MGATGSRTRWLCFFQAEDGIRDYKVTGVQTCALPICTDRPREVGGHRGHEQLDLAAIAEPDQVRWLADAVADERDERRRVVLVVVRGVRPQIGRASCRERV